MNLQTFYENFDLLAESPNGVQKLRNLILQLAVQGKLIPQNSNDEPASVLLEKIKAEKERLIQEKKIKKDKKEWTLSKATPSWSIPKNWQWVKLQDIFEISRGGSPRPSGDPIYFGGNIPWITVGEITKDKLKHLYDTSEFLTEEGQKRSRTIQPNDLLLTNSGATLGVPKISMITGCINDGVALLRQFHSYDFNDYTYLFLFGQTDVFRKVNQGMGQPNLNTSILAAWFLPLPPLEEQKRIIAKVDQLMKLCDELEQCQQKKHEARVRLNQSALDHMLAASTPEEFNAYRQSIYTNFDLLYDTPETIGKLRQSILQLAVQGKLVPQNHNDEPALMLLERTQTSNTKNSKLKMQDSVLEDFPFAPPNNWAFVRLGRVLESLRYGTSKQCSYERKGSPVLRIPNIGNGFIKGDDLKFTMLANKELQELELKQDDLLMVRSNGSKSLVGRLAIVGSEFEAYAFAGYLVRLRILPELVYPKFLFIASETAYVREQIEFPIRTTSGVKNINSTEISNLVIPLPPLEEQKRIVSKVDQLMKLCDELEARLTQAQTTSESLMASIVNHLFSTVQESENACAALFA